MKIIPLGTNGYVSSFNRQTACYVIPLDDQLIILDAGSGLFRFMEPIGKNLLKDKKKVKIFLSHYHLDHTFGFYAAFELFEKMKVDVYGMEERHVYSELVNLGQFPVDYEKKHHNFRWIKVNEKSYRNDGLKFTVRVQKHRLEKSLGYRLELANGKKLAYLTDTDNPSMESIYFVKGVDILLHEHDTLNVPKYSKNSRLEDLIKGGHVTTEGAALIAREAKVKKLYLIHHNPPCDWITLEKDLKKARKIFSESYLAEDLKTINI